jgi:hypothetical protein
MKIKIIPILIGFVALLSSAVPAQACSIYNTANCPHDTAHNYYPTNSVSNNTLQPSFGADTPNTTFVYTPALPQIYGNTSTYAQPQVGQSPTDYTSSQFINNQVVPPQSTYISQPIYVPAAPIIMNGNGAQPQQNSGTTSGTSNTTSSTDTENTPNLWESIFGSSTNKKFSNNVSDSQIDTNLKALVNSKGLAMGTNGAQCETGGQYVILYKNITGVPLSNVALRMSLPNGLTPTNANGGSYSERDNTVTVFIGNLTANQEGQIVITTKRTDAVSGVARTEMVYTLPNQTQNMIVSYAFGDGECSNTNALGASVSGSGLFGGTLLGWLFLALFVSAFIYLIRFFLGKRHAPNGHAPAHGH